MKKNLLSVARIRCLDILINKNVYECMFGIMLIRVYQPFQYFFVNSALDIFLFENTRNNN